MGRHGRPQGGVETMNQFLGFDEATNPQIRAADPRSASWVSANAGSGKTKVLTDRVARLLLSGTPPQRVLCLTFTIAAASNMQNRLFERLGGWSMLKDEDLRNELLALGEDRDSLDGEYLKRARTLFARALETPGGLRIQTIHAFASTILKRFPLEAGVSPQFKSLDDRTAGRIHEDVLDRISVNSPSTYAKVAAHVNVKGLQNLVGEIAGNRVAFASRGSEDDICRIFGLTTPFCPPETMIRDLLTQEDSELIRQLMKFLRRGSKADQSAAGKLENLNFSDPAIPDFSLLQSVFLFGAKANNPFAPKTGSFPTKKVRNEMGEINSRVEDYMERVSNLRMPILRAQAAAKTMTLHDFAHDLLREFEQHKSRVSSLDFDDLILKTLELLSNPETAQWVLYKLDGGIDHILVDEAQDVSKTQWNIISGIAEEFTSGLGARQSKRTVFAVGDEKQSIYGFQGAAPEKFKEMRDHFRMKYREAGQKFTEEGLEFSFRSSPAVLEVVDRVFEGRSEPGFGGATVHRAFMDESPGRVDLWPIIGEPEKPGQPEWHGAQLVPGETQAPAKLARLLATEIRRMTHPDSAESLQTENGARPIQCGDILILVRRRNDLFHSIIAELKSAGLPVAGTDRMLLSESLAVLDVRALLSFLATPADDLSLAAALRSPIFQMTEEELFSVAHGRNGKSLWSSLQERKADFSQTVSIIRDLLNGVDRLKPYELIERLLTCHKGRELLTARLGNEISEPLDAFLQQAITYDDEEAPSLTGFLEWSNNDLEIKRQLDQAGNEVRIMTIHGAKGLESPIVILPDTSERRPPQPGNLLLTEEGLPIWNTTMDSRPEVVADAIDRYAEQAENEHLRLLYVALTRAESWLIIAGAGKAKENSWHGLVEAGLSACSPKEVKVPELGGCDWPFDQFQRHSFGEWPEPVAAGEKSAAVSDSLPRWIHERAPKPEQPPALRSPSGLGGNKSLSTRKTTSSKEESESPDDAADRGTMIHLLLEHLPPGGGSSRRKLAENVLECAFPQLTKDRLLDAYREATRILDNSDLKDLFGDHSLAEVGITASLKGLSDNRVLGYIDRLIIEDDQVLAVDFKSNRNVPSSENEVPEAILRQLGAYQDALEQIFPDRGIDVAVLWTRTGNLMRIDPNLCRCALARSQADHQITESNGSIELDAFGENFK